MRDNLFNIKARVYGTVFGFVDLENGAAFVFAEIDEQGRGQEPDAPQSLWIKLDKRRAQKLGSSQRLEVRPAQPVCEAALVIEPTVRRDHPDYSLPPELR
jgi:hypothetical protein